LVLGAQTVAWCLKRYRSIFKSNTSLRPLHSQAFFILKSQL
jgi:hypothetical protein